MAVYDTGPIDNRQFPRTTQLTIRLFNTGRKTALAGAEAYFINPAGGGLASKTIYAVSLVSLNPFNEPDCSFTVDNVDANLDVFGVRVITSGRGANDIAITVLEKGADGQVINEHVLRGEFSKIGELLFLYAANGWVVDTGTNNVVTNVTGFTPGTGVAITPDGSRAYITNNGSASITIIDTATNTVLTIVPAGNTNPTDLAFTPDGSRLYVCCGNGATASVTVLDTGTNTVITSIPMPPTETPNGIAITPDGTRAYVPVSDDTVLVIDTATNAVVTTVPLTAGGNPTGVAITPDGTRAYVPNFFLNTVSVINTVTNTVVATVNLPAGSLPFGIKPIAITPDGSRAYVANNGNGTVSVINTNINLVEVTVTFPAGSEPFSIAIHPDGSRVYISNSFRSTIFVIDAATNTFGTLSVGKFPNGLAVTPILLF
ncbi:beta-propeller fold lactonase family protein [Paenibacillus sp. MBLB4367]|uniref:beta-propeller fold lactonase family protein n=1 Tax=Paenibacillus sp. MBLB4367 TaxID=3384767 RepID=UPI0039080C07